MLINVFLIATCSITAIWLGVSLLLAWENRRFSLVRLSQSLKIRNREHRVAVFLPCKGNDEDFLDNLVAFFKQHHPNYQLNLIVESKEDPAWSVIQQTRVRFPEVESRVVVAGVATTDGQKVHNLRAATQDIAEDVKILAFADADIRPSADWLQALTITVCKNKKTIANTGYRLMLPQKNSLTNLIVYSINAAVAGSMGSGKHFLIWGGSWAIRRTNFDRLKIREAWQRTLSDDLVASSVIRNQGENIGYAPRCLCKTEFDLSPASALEFVRRQYLIGRKYAPRMFWPGYLLLAVNVISWWSLVVLGVLGAGSIAWIGVGIIHLANAVKSSLRQSVLFRKYRSEFKKHRVAAAFDVLASPLVMTVNFLVMTWSLMGSQIWWRENHYHIFTGGQIEKLNPAGPPLTESPIQSVSSNKRLKNQESNRRTTDSLINERAA